MKLSIKLIKSYIPSDYFDGSKLKGVSLTKNSYNLFCNIKGEEYTLLTDSSNPLLDILSKTFEIKYVKHFYWHYSEYTIKSK
jgi:hypothetical protein